MKNLCLVISMFAFVACATNEKTEEKNPFNAITLKEKIIEGKTTQSEILETFGAPDITTESEQKEDVWTYAKTSTKNQGTSAGVGALALFLPGPLYGIGGSFDKHEDETATKSVSVIIKFNKKKIVKSYSISRSKI